MLEITIHDIETQESETISTDGCLVLYFDKNSNIRTSGKINLKAVTPLISKVILEKLVK